MADGTVITMTANESLELPVLPDFTRWQWASNAERAWWSPLFTEASNAFKEVERLTVVKGLRKAAWHNLTTTELIEAQQWAFQNGLMLVPISTTGSSGVYSTKGTPGSNVVRAVYTTHEHYKAILPWNDDERIGELLGFPACCRQSFLATWGQKQVDSTWEQWDATTHPKNLAHTLFRPFGLRLVSHMPCSFNCEASQRIAEQFYQIGAENGMKEQMLILKEVLNWPISRWSRLFGIAEMVTPGLKLVTRSDWTPTLQEAKDTSGGYNKPEAYFWTDNGFNSAEGMRAAHAMLINSLEAALSKGARVLDLGCGNGMLLRRLTISRPDIKIAGVDSNASAIKHAPSLIGKWWSGRIESESAWTSWNADAVLVNPIRLVEMSQSDAAQTRKHLDKIAQVFVYAYPDVVKDRSLEQLTANAGFTRTFQPLQHTPQGTVGMLAQP